MLLRYNSLPRQDVLSQHTEPACGGRSLIQLRTLIPTLPFLRVGCHQDIFHFPNYKMVRRWWRQLIIIFLCLRNCLVGMFSPSCGVSGMLESHQSVRPGRLWLLMLISWLALNCSLRHRTIQQSSESCARCIVSYQTCHIDHATTFKPGAPEWKLGARTFSQLGRTFQSFM